MIDPTTAPPAVLSQCSPARLAGQYHISPHHRHRLPIHLQSPLAPAKLRSAGERPDSWTPPVGRRRRRPLANTTLPSTISGLQRSRKRSPTWFLVESIAIDSIPHRNTRCCGMVTSIAPSCGMVWPPGSPESEPPCETACRLLSFRN